ncbi:response regulator [Amorphus orientalis]|uniref:Two-component system phosphate regulon response regulator OmpR n=1 Tax=Amorphus orientalis TaxID=649198 RepID=A0AAE4ARU2_9HYPH|nr:response regulator transcription factor [Amorphus orientalis]MDQ0314235.1 two-component system phosphate regulon response regulator OmpR [Amorphus orientalis]
MSTTPVPSDDAAHLLIVDDDSRIRSLLHRYLAGEGYRVSEAADAAEARRKLQTFAFDLVVLDVMMPHESGFDLMQSSLAGKDLPVIMLTALGESDNRINGLELGADDYITKPFEPRELVLRIARVLKRNATQKQWHSSVAFGEFVFDLEREELRTGETTVRLTDRERILLKTFAEQPGETIPRHQLVTEETRTSERTVDVQINRLRRKIEEDPANPRYLQTIRGVGYRLMADPRD